jgi:hypothetical protein
MRGHLSDLNCVSLVKSSALGPSIFSSHFFLYKLAVMNVNRHEPCINTFYSSCHRAIERERDKEIKSTEGTNIVVENSAVLHDPSLQFPIINAIQSVSYSGQEITTHNQKVHAPARIDIHYYFDTYYISIS